MICPEHTEDLREAVVHGVLHLAGMDHETDDGEMLALQARDRWRGCDDPLGLRRARRPAERRQVDAGQRDGRRARWRSSPTSRRRRAARSAASSTGADDWQLVLVDLPGVQRPRDALTERMQRRVERELAEADAALFVLNGEQGVGGPGDRFIAEALRSARRCRSSIAVNKVDRLDRAAHGRGAARRPPSSALGDERLPGLRAHAARASAALVEHLAALLPEGPFYFPPEESPTSPRSVLLAELVREQVLRRTARRSARGRGAGRRDRASATTSLDVRALRVGRDRVPEGHPDRRRRRA